MCSRLAGVPLPGMSRLSAGDGEREPLHAVCSPRALPPHRRHQHHRCRAAVLHQLPGQTVHPALVPQGWERGPVPWAWALLHGPKVPASLLSTPPAPFFSSSSCRCLCLGHLLSLLDSDATRLCFSLSPLCLGGRVVVERTYWSPLTSRCESEGHSLPAPEAPIPPRTPAASPSPFRKLPSSLSLQK